MTPMGGPDTPPPVPPLPVWFLALAMVGGVLAGLFLLVLAGVDVAAWLA